MQHIVHELLAGVTTFFSMVYILVLIPQILSLGGIPFGAALSIVVATIIFTTLLASCIGGYPVAAGPGLSVLTYLAYSLVGTNSATWPQALGLVFWGGIAIFIISITQLRQLILIQIPDTLKRAAIAGLGLFFIVIGLKQLGIIQIESYGFSLSSLEPSNKESVFLAYFFSSCCKAKK
jgi:AGZA family xanthine/uracil permease-like MFS transporter